MDEGIYIIYCPNWYDIIWILPIMRINVFLDHLHINSICDKTIQTLLINDLNLIGKECFPANIEV
jgi:hypothetical protein